MKAPDPDFSYVYLVGVPGGPTKIGHAMCVKRRFKQLQAEYPLQELVPMGSWPVGALKARAVEHYVHWLLREKNYRGEWFNVARDEAVAAIKKGIEQEANLDVRPMIPPVDVSNQLGKYRQHVKTMLRAGTLESMDKVLSEGETRSDFTRSAIEAELKRRERTRPSKTS